MKTIIYVSIGLWVAIAVFISNPAQAQDARYSMQHSNLLTLNPSLAGANKFLRFGLNYRNQWGSLEKGFTSYAATGFYPLILGKGNAAMQGESENSGGANTVNSKLDFGLGAQYYMAGAFKTLDIMLSVGYTVRLAENHYLSSAILGSYSQKSLDAGSLTFDDQYVLGFYNESNPTTELVLDKKASYPSFGFGVTWFYNEGNGAKLNSYLGASAFNLNQPNQSFTGEKGILPIRYSLQGGVRIIGNKLDIIPNVVYSSQRSSHLLGCGVNTEVKFGDKSRMILGAAYRFGDAATFLVGFDYDYFNLGYAYDLTTSNITKCITGLNTHNVTLSFKLDQAKKKNMNINDPNIYF
jgi:type IX secretion system PorP/SprF family membrane protein